MARVWRIDRQQEGLPVTACFEGAPRLLIVRRQRPCPTLFMFVGVVAALPLERVLDEKQIPVLLMGLSTRPARSQLCQQDASYYCTVSSLPPKHKGSSRNLLE